MNGESRNQCDHENQSTVKELLLKNGARGAQSITSIAVVLHGIPLLLRSTMATTQCLLMLGLVCRVSNVIYQWTMIIWLKIRSACSETSAQLKDCAPQGALLHHLKHCERLRLSKQAFLCHHLVPNIGAELCCIAGAIFRMQGWVKVNLHLSCCPPSKVNALCLIHFSLLVSFLLLQFNLLAILFMCFPKQPYKI